MVFAIPDINMENPYLLCGQINMNKSPTSTTELAIFIKDAMKRYRFKDEFRCGFQNGRNGHNNYNICIFNLIIIS